MTTERRTPIRPPGTLLRLYRTFSPAVCQAAEQAAAFSPKLADGLAGRRGLRRRLRAAADRLQGCVWFHVTSVGEFEQARPLIAALRARDPAVPIAVTHYSPSGYGFAMKRPCADLHDYLPLDHPALMAELMDAWQPRLLVFVKFDCWPNQVLAAERAGVPVVLLAGSLQPRSGRLHPLVRPLFRDVFDRFAHIGVCTAEDRDRFVRRLGVSCPVSVTGDTRAEQVILRYESAAAGEVAARLRGLGGRRLILGSTWPRDEALWLPVLPELLKACADLKVVLTPHEPDPHRLAALEAGLRSAGIAHRRLSALMAGTDAGGGDPRVVLVDSIGQLAEVYRAGHLAYVGGSFTTGVHNTMEPAVAGLPVMFGPVIQNAEEAGRMVARGVGFVLRRPPEAAACVRKLLADPGLLDDLGRKARQVVLDQRGATARSLEILGPLLP